MCTTVGSVASNEGRLCRLQSDRRAGDAALGRGCCRVFATTHWRLHSDLRQAWGSKTYGGGVGSPSRQGKHGRSANLAADRSSVEANGLHTTAMQMARRPPATGTGAGGVFLRKPTHGPPASTLDSSGSSCFGMVTVLHASGGLARLTIHTRCV